MNFNDFKRELSKEQQELRLMTNEINMMCAHNLQHTDAFKTLIRKHNDLEYALHRARITNATNTGVSMSNVLSFTNTKEEKTMETSAQTTKRLEYVDYLTTQQDYDMDELMAMPLPELRALVDQHQVKRITQTYVNPNGSVSRKVTERKAA